MVSIFHYFNLFSFDKQTLTGFLFCFLLVFLVCLEFFFLLHGPCSSTRGQSHTVNCKREGSDREASHILYCSVDTCSCDCYNYKRHLAAL